MTGALHACSCSPCCYVVIGSFVNMSCSTLRKTSEYQYLKMGSAITPSLGVNHGQAGREMSESVVCTEAS